jgi:hypothetical protein
VKPRHKPEPVGAEVVRQAEIAKLQPKVDAASELVAS